MKRFSVKKVSLVLMLMLLMTSMSACSNSSPPVKDVDNTQDVDTSTEKVDIMVSAAISLTDAMEELKNIYEEENQKVNIIYNFGASGALMQQIEEGAPVDLFLSAAQKQMNELEDKDLIIKESRLDFVGNDLVLIVNENHQDTIKSVNDLLNLKDEKIAMGEPESVPAGKYTADTLTNLGLYDDLLDNIVFTKNVRQVITYVDSENAVAGFCYGSDTTIATNSVITEFVKEESHEPIIYPAAIIKDSKNPETAEGFLNFITTNKAKEVFEKHGFIRID